MDDHPDLRSLGQGPVFHQVHPARDRLHNALATALLWLVFVLVMAAAPCAAPPTCGRPGPCWNRPCRG